ncbi:MAG TPA: sodium-dependent transporter [Gemmatimonadaceae bacterium]|nr:sodium-dependent transporter [Gemmatimonadaceae bacterium]
MTAAPDHSSGSGTRIVGAQADVREPARQTFATRFGIAMTMLGVAVGLGNIWRFPYMVGRYGGAAFVAFYLVVVLAIGIPGLMAEWALGRHTRRGTVGAFERGRLPFGRAVGWFFFAVVASATGYYTNVIGWVLFHAVGEMAGAVGVPLGAAAVLPPDSGFSARSFGLQLVFTAVVMLSCAVVLLKGLRAGIERTSTVLMPALFVILLLFIARSLTLPGGLEGARWYLLKFELADLTPRVMVAAMGQAIFSLSLGGTFMVVYGSYLGAGDDLAKTSVITAVGDSASGLLAGLAIIPAVLALGLEPGSGPALLFSTLPHVFAEIPAGRVVGILFYAGLMGAGYLSAVAAFEVLVAGVTDNTRLSRRSAVWLMTVVAFVLAIPPMINMRVFLPWDLTFGSGMQTLGALLAVLTVGWAMDRSAALGELASGRDSMWIRVLYYWIRFAVPAAIIAVGAWWTLSELLGVVRGV